MAKSPQLSPRQAAQMFKLLGDESRLRILGILADGREQNVTQLRAAIGQSQPAISHHLMLLRLSGLVQARRDGANNYYSIDSLVVRGLVRMVKF